MPICTNVDSEDPRGPSIKNWRPAKSYGLGALEASGPKRAAAYASGSQSPAHTRSATDPGFAD